MCVCGCVCGVFWIVNVFKSECLCDLCICDYVQKITSLTKCFGRVYMCVRVCVHICVCVCVTRISTWIRLMPETNCLCCHKQFTIRGNWMKCNAR